jgi:acetyl-CoA C-acetyltransferase
MREAVVVASSRTPLAKSFRGSLNMTRPDDFAAHCIQDVLRKTPQLDPTEIEDVVLGCADHHGPQSLNVARIAAIRAGLPASVAGLTINRFCSSGLQAIVIAAHEIIHEGAAAAIAGGVESITAMQALQLDPKVAINPWVYEHEPGLYIVMGDTARAQQEGFFAEELAPLQVTRAILDKKTGAIVGQEEHYLDRDECNRPDTTLEGLAALKPYFDPKSGLGSVTAGNSSQMSDGASATLLMERKRAEELGIQAKVAFRGFAVAGCEPDEMGIGPVFAVPKLLQRHGLKVSDIDLWELNEAFAVQVVYCRDRLGIDPDKLNVNGGSIAIGHPYGMTGSRLVGTIANEMVRRKARYGVVCMCIGGGQGAAGLFELCD